MKFHAAVVIVVVAVLVASCGKSPRAPFVPSDPDPEPTQSSVKIISISPASGTEIKASACWARVRVVSDYLNVGEYANVQVLVVYYLSVDGETLLGGSGRPANDSSGRVVNDVCLMGNLAYENIAITNFVIARLELRTADYQTVIEVLAQDRKDWVFLWDHNQ